MTKPFPDIAVLQENFAPVMAECTAPDLIVEGELPVGLAGTLYRTGPNPMFPPLGEKHHWFLGEGMVHAIHIEDGKASYRNRWVETDLYKAQRQEGRRLKDTTFEGAGEPGFEHISRNVANTNIVWHGDKLLAIDEGSSPVSMDPVTLETHGPWDFEGKYKGPMTAHPKIDPVTGEMLFFGYMASGPGSKDYAYNVIDASGKLTKAEMFEGPYACMMHDFITTDEHVIFPLFPATIDIDRIMKGGPMIAWDQEERTYLGVMARNESVEKIRWFEGDPCYVYHPMNAFSIKEGGKVKLVADMMKYNRVPLFPNADGSELRELGEDAGQLVRWVMDLSGNTNSYTETQLTDVAGEFPRIDERRTGLSYRQGFYATILGEKEAGTPFDTIVHADLETGQTVMYRPGPGKHVHEPVFVPRSKTAAEGDGYLVTLVYDKATNLSDFIVLDTGDISKGPIATVHLPIRVPFGFHGNWRAD